MVYKGMDSPTPPLPGKVRIEKSLPERVRHLIASSALLVKERPVILAVSGGPDSICLLHLLSALFPDTKRIAVYVDHGLRPLEIPAEKDLVREQAERCGALFVTVAVNVQAERERRKSSLEAAARSLRYRALEEIRYRHGAQAIAVAHTADDQAEEILLRLIRGSGSTGLSGMALRRGSLIRPLLGETKESLLGYLQENHIPFCHDSSNDDTRFLRNRIRQELLPILEKGYNPAIRRSLLHTASILGEEDSLLAHLSKGAYQTCVREEDAGRLILDLAAFSGEHRAIRRRILDRLCWEMGSRPSFQKIDSLLKLAVAPRGREVHLSHGLRAIRQGDGILFHHPSQDTGYRGPAVPARTFPPLSIPAPGSYPVPELARELILTADEDLVQDPQDSTLLLIDAERITFPLLLRAHLPGERFHPLGAPGRKKISRFLSDQKIPAGERSQHPVLLSGDSIIAVLGLRSSEAVRVRQSSKKTLALLWKKKV